MANRKLRKMTSLARKVLRRAMGLPRGKQFIKYSANRVAFMLARWGRKLRLPHPTSLMLEVTNVCQLRCVICPREYALGSAMDKGHMDIASAKRLIDENHVYLDIVGLTGLGETLLYPHLVDLVEHIRSRNKGLYIFISTNAQLPDAPQIADAIADKIDALQISIDGCGEVFERIRKNSSWDKYLANLREIARVATGRRVGLKFNMVVLKDNHHQMVDVVKLARSLNIPEVYFNTMNLVANDWDTSYYDLYHTDVFKKALREAVDLADRVGIVVGYDDITSPRTFGNCPFPWNHFYITWDGFLVPCCAKPFPKEKHFGNVFESGLVNCVNDAGVMEFRELSNKGITPEFCLRCHVVTAPPQRADVGPA
jgi:radical SAM protein with 4Fe4S-binding SPASM domain